MKNIRINWICRYYYTYRLWGKISDFR